MKIGIDFDDTIVKTTEKLKEYMEKYNIVKFNTIEEEIEFHDKYLAKMTYELQLMDNVINVLNKLSKDNELFLITARSSKDIIKATKKFIKKNKLPFKKLYFGCFGIGKLNKCLELNIDLFVDDDILNVAETNKKIKTIYFNGDDKKYLCLNHWTDILKEVNKWKNE